MLSKGSDLTGGPPEGRGGVGGKDGLTYDDATGTDQSDLFLQGDSAPSGTSLGAGVRLAPTWVFLFGVVSVPGSFFHPSQQDCNLQKLPPFRNAYSCKYIGRGL